MYIVYPIYLLIICIEGPCIPDDILPQIPPGQNGPYIDEESEDIYDLDAQYILNEKIISCIPIG